MSEFTIDFPRDQVKQFERALKRVETDLGKSSKDAIYIGARQLLKSLATSTKVSEEFRDYELVGQSRSGLNNAYKVHTKYATPKRKGKALRRSWQGPWRDQLIYAKDVNELKQRPALIIAMRGIARESWLQAGRKGWINIGVPKTETAKRREGIMKKAARRWVRFTKKFGSTENYIHVSNNIRHIEQALVGGKKSVDDAMSRAARGVEKTIDNYLKKAAAKAAA